MSDLQSDTFWLTVLMLALLVFMIVAPFLYIYLRRKTAKPRIKTTPAVPLAENPPAPNPPPTEPSPAKPARPNLPQPKPASPEQRLSAAYRVTFIVGLFTLANAILPLAAWIMPETFSTYQTGSWLIYLRSAIAGALLLILGFLIKRRSSPAVIAAMILFALNGLFDFIYSVNNAVSTTILFCNGLYILFILSLMYGGIRAIKELKQADITLPEINTDYQH